MRIARFAFASAASMLVVLSTFCGGEEPEPSASACANDGDCEDGDPCTTNVCTDDRRCEAKPAAAENGIDLTDGDCARTVCKDGEPVRVADAGDPEDDGNPCTLDQCQGLVTRHLPFVEGGVCNVGSAQGTCTAERCVVPCQESENPAFQCDDGNPCTDDACVPCDDPACTLSAECKFTPSDGTVVLTNIGDCTTERCAGDELVSEPTPKGGRCVLAGPFVCSERGFCGPACAANGNCALALYTNYEGGSLTVDVDEDVKNLVIGVVSYHSVDIRVVGDFAGNVVAVHYAGYDDEDTTSATGIEPGTYQSEKSPPSPIFDPEGASSLICAYEGSTDCASKAQVAAYFGERFPGTTVAHVCRYDAFEASEPYVLSAKGSCEAPSEN